MIKNKEVKDYLRKIRKMIPGGKGKKQILEQIHRSVEAYLEENPNADWTAFQNHFGTPEQISASYIEGMEPDEILGKFKKKRIIVGVVVGAVVLAVLGWCIILFAAWRMEVKHSGGYYEVEIIETTEETK